jgi:hemerythrin
MLKQWSDEYRIGLSEIDQQHQGFFAAAHQLYDKILNCEGELVVEETVSFLRNYAEKHFRDEEALMSEYAYPQLAEHQRLHIQFFEQLDQLTEDLKVFGPSQHLADRALEIAQDWLIDHIADVDVQYAAHIRKTST